MAMSEEELDELFIRTAGLDRNLYYRWKVETQSGKRPASVGVSTELLEHALKRDHAVNPNLEAYTFLTPEKREEILTRHAAPPSTS